MEALVLAGLPTDLFSRHGAKVSTFEYFDLWRAVEELAGRDDLALKFGQAVSGVTFDPSIFASLCSHNLNEGLERLAQFKRLVGPMDLAVDITGKKTVATVRFYGCNGRLPTSVGMVELVFFTAFARLGSRQNVIPRKLELPEPPVVHQDRYHKYFGRKITTGKHTRIAFDADDAARPFVTENRMMLDFFEPGLRERLSDLDEGTPVSQRVKSILLQLLPSGKSSIEQAAGKLAMSPRTLQRHLAKESLNYKAILNGTRRELVEHYFAQANISNDEISYLLGYQDTNSFLRAFKDWTGVSPGQYRQPLLKNGSIH